MTITATGYWVQHTGDGTNSALAVNFPYTATTDLIVTKRVTATGAETELTETTHYTVSAAGASGTVTPVDGATDFPSTVTWTISRTVPKTQGADLVENDEFPSETVEDALDRSALHSADLQEQADRSLHYPVTDLSSLSSEIPNSVDRASKYFGFDGSGEPTVLSSPTDTALTTTYIETLLDDANAEDARATLEVSNVIGSITVVAANAAADTVDVTITVLDGIGLAAGSAGSLVSAPVAVLVWLSDASTGIGGSAHTHSTGPAFTTGEEISEFIANDSWLVLTNGSGSIVLRLVDTANEDVTINAATTGGPLGQDTTVAGDWS